MTNIASDLAQVESLKAAGVPFHAGAKWLGTTRRDSARVTAIAATLGPADEPVIHGVAIFGTRRGPALTLTLEGAARLADQLDELLAAAEDAQ